VFRQVEHVIVAGSTIPLSSCFQAPNGAMQCITPLVWRMVVAAVCSCVADEERERKTKTETLDSQLLGSCHLARPFSCLVRVKLGRGGARACLLSCPSPPPPPDSSDFTLWPCECERERA